MKKLLFVSAIGMLSSCGSNDFPTACDCFHNYHEDNSIDQQMYAYNNPSKVHSTFKFVADCLEKFGSEEAKRVRGTNEFILQMHLSLKDKCDE